MEPDESYFWATHNGAELDLLLIKDGKKYGVECKRSDAPKLTPSMLTAMNDLELEKLTVLYSGDKTYRLGDRIIVSPLALIGTDQVNDIVVSP